MHVVTDRDDGLFEFLGSLGERAKDKKRGEE